MGVREWKLIERNSSGVIDTKTDNSLFHLMILLVGKLRMCIAIDSLDKGEFVRTQNTFNKEILTKRYVITIKCPYTVIEIRKQTKGSINQEEFMATLNIIKEKYGDRI